MDSGMIVLHSKTSISGEDACSMKLADAGTGTENQMFFYSPAVHVLLNHIVQIAFSGKRHDKAWFIFMRECAQACLNMRVAKRL